jgi:large subunit ribosomal protein L31
LGISTARVSFPSLVGAGLTWPALSPRERLVPTLDLETRRDVKGTHPETIVTTVRCSTCESEFAIRSPRTELIVDVCSSCHPAYTGEMRPAPGGSRIERFERRRALGRATAVVA